MSAWMHGYFAESGYSYGYYPETMPSRLYWASLINGVVCPRQSFRYLDLGCGQGVNLLLAAAMHPESEFVGVDFYPAHVVHGRKLARQAGLTNVTFIEADFLAVAENDHDLRGQFDYVVAHGISSWISGEVRNALFSIAASALNQGGVFYNSYNTMPGWLPVVPFQYLVLQELGAHGGKGALDAARKTFEQLRASNSALFASLPSLFPRLEKISELDPAYLVQEYNNQAWKPAWSTDMIREAASNKLEFLGSATLVENFDQNFPSEMRELIGKEPAGAKRELIKDLCMNQSFRRDLYIKGLARDWSLSVMAEIGRQRVMSNSLKKLPADGEPFEIASGAVNIKGNFQAYSRIISAIDGLSGAPTLDAVAEATGLKMTELTFMISMLIHAGWVSFGGEQAEAVEVSARLNARISQEVAAGAPYRYLACGNTGQAIGVSELDLLALHNQIQNPKVEMSQQIEDMQSTLRSLGRTLLREGKAVDDVDQLNAIVKGALETFNKNIVHWQKLGALRPV